MTSYRERISKILRDARTEAGLSQSEVVTLLQAQNVNIDTTRLSRFETGERTPGIKKLVGFSAIYDIDIDTLLPAFSEQTHAKNEPA